MNLPGYPLLRQTVLRLTGVDLDGYRSSQLERRLGALIRRVGASDLAEYARMLAADPARVREFRDFLTINVTEFFRNPEKFAELGQRYLPELKRANPRLRIWSAGCANGAEAYSVAILLAEMDPAGQHEIWATDLDEDALRQAQVGAYLERDLREVSPERRRRHFTQAGDRWVVRPHLRRLVRFQVHNLLADPFPQSWDLILCRNVVIYFSDEAKEALYRRFRQALRPGGILFVGGTESLLRARELGFTPVTPFFYRAGP